MNMKKLYGNSEIISDEEEIIVEKLKNNLIYANSNTSVIEKRKSVYECIFKRLIDIIISIIAIIILSPIMLITAAGTLFFLGRPIIFRQTRVGVNMRPFNMYKFRSLMDIRGKDGKMVPMDQRLTPFGKFIRMTSLDEILNFINIIKGDMSIVGPRPMPVFYVERMSERHKCIFQVKPGLESPIHFIPDLFGGAEDDYQFHIKFENDIWYVEHIGFITDIKKIIRLIKLVFSKNKRMTHAVMGTNFVGYDKQGRALSLRIAKKYPEEI